MRDNGIIGVAPIETIGFASGTAACGASQSHAGRGAGGHPDTTLHQVMLVVNGIHLLENLKLEELASKRINGFAFLMQPLKAAGFAGSTVAPVAIR